jgi:uncharacterized membrane protein HdeD (DUF308 family)
MYTHLLRVFLIFNYSILLAASTSSTIGDLAFNLISQAPAWELLITAVTYLIGISFIISGVIKIKNHRDAPQQVPLLAPIIFLIVGAFLIYFPSTIQILAETIFGSSTGLQTGAGIWSSNTLIEGSTLVDITSQ